MLVASTEAEARQNTPTTTFNRCTVNLQTWPRTRALMPDAGVPDEALRVRIFAGCAETIRPARGFAAGILAVYCKWPRARSSIGPAQTAVAIG